MNIVRDGNIETYKTTKEESELIDNTIQEIKNKYNDRGITITEREESHILFFCLGILRQEFYQKDIDAKAMIAGYVSNHTYEARTKPHSAGYASVKYE